MEQDPNNVDFTKLLEKRVLMATSEDFTTFVLELLNPIHPVTPRKMFGGVGIYADGQICALINSTDVLHFKVDDENKADYVAAEARQFMRMPYFEVPADVLENNDELRLWFEKSVAVSKRAGEAKNKKKK